MASLLPETLVGPDKQPVASSTLAGKVLGLYFSAHWCPPCRGFTPKLCQWYSDFKSKHPSGDKLELVFLSSDRDEASFKEYHNEMNFYAVPFADRDAKAALSAKFAVRGIPTLVFVDAEGNTLSRDGRAIVMEDPEGAKFPWTPKTFAEMLGDSFVNNKDEAFNAPSLAGKVLGIYFSAHWCGPCRGFTPVLISTYNKLKAAGKPFEIIFVSSDRDKASYEEYFATMPWLSIGYGQDDRKAELSRHFEVDGIPTLIILNEHHKVITAEGRGAIGADPNGENFPWLPKPLNPLDDGAQSVINDFPFLVAETDETPEGIERVKAALKDAADAEFAKDAPKLKFFYLASKDEEIYEAIAKFAKISEKEKLYIVAAQQQKKFVADTTEITPESVGAFVNAFLSGSLKGTSLH